MIALGDRVESPPVKPSNKITLPPDRVSKRKRKKRRWKHKRIEVSKIFDKAAGGINLVPNKSKEKIHIMRGKDGRVVGWYFFFGGFFRFFLSLLFALDCVRVISS
ncbi:hypothetical protein ASPZODRAFT_1460954 [Penicilliopsis zonata CBS 506.65]|uniref:Uncharacterized protein n=1 Tax=Penicilliopsis zonata CBS 506.65 TaxID=1073090 RepID=A0A1L9SQ23_9EURO|nr:hypothetical protein ASPZODRAFT_1460954 [Penicilliopsis zonata CBS 506.65]OJJ49349.1 hypothetical protein ASPZODRAFT_1460954 [Penicilliopsis zonata CBS 506.65]